MRLSSTLKVDRLKINKPTDFSPDACFVQPSAFSFLSKCLVSPTFRLQPKTLSRSGQVIKVWAYPQVADGVLGRYKEENKTRGKEYTLADRVNISPPLRGGDKGEGDACGVTNGRINHQFRKRALNLASAVTEEILKLYISYKSTTNFVDVVPKKAG
jgi:hypothetical protein